MFVVGTRGGYVDISMSGTMVCIRAIGEPTGDDFRVALRIAADEGWFVPDVDCLIDTRFFTGTIDWDMVRDARAFAPWIQRDWTGAAPVDVRCAYVIEDRIMARVLTVIGFLFPGARHRAFPDEAAARSWLGMEAADP
ncbi:MAG: hypothetical protein RLY86_2116 [Pseudomonadota bacterium]|jgi:hypothetical protein